MKNIDQTKVTVAQSQYSSLSCQTDKIAENHLGVVAPQSQSAIVD